jgi:hypothetical protein
MKVKSDTKLYDALLNIREIESSANKMKANKKNLKALEKEHKRTIAHVEKENNEDYVVEYMGNNNQSQSNKKVKRSQMSDFKHPT